MLWIKIMLRYRKYLSGDSNPKALGVQLIIFKKKGAWPRWCCSTTRLPYRATQAASRRPKGLPPFYWVTQGALTMIPQKTA